MTLNVFLLVFILLIFILLHAFVKLWKFLRLKNKSLLIKIFILVLFFYIYSVFFHIMLLAASSKELAFFWLKFSFLVRPLFFSSVTLLVVVLFKEYKSLNFRTILLVFLPALPMVVFGMIGLLEVKDIIIIPYGNMIVFNTASFWFYYHILFLVSSFFIQIFLIAKRALFSKSNRTRAEAVFFVFSYSVAWVGIFSAKFILPILFDDIVNLSQIDFVFFVIIIVATIHAYDKYSFMNDKLSDNFEGVLDAIKDGIIVTDTTGSFVRCNRSASEIIFDSIENRCSGNLREIFSDCDFLTEAKEIEAKGSVKKNKTMIRVRKKDLIVELSCSVLFDEFNDFIGFLVIFRPNLKLEEAIKKFEFTEREIQVILLLEKGWDYKMLAKELHIAENTVRNHIQHIFVKAGVTKQSHLFKLVF